MKIRGADISTYLQEKACGARFFEDGSEKELFEILKNNGVNYIRLRIWNDPYSPDGRPYGAGGNDLGTVVKTAKLAVLNGMKLLLDFHYSDFWADPGKQFKPKAWADLDFEGLKEAVYAFTLQTLETMERENVYPDMVQVGNEITNGLLWPDGKYPEYSNIAELVGAGIRAVKESGIKRRGQRIPQIMIHLDRGTDKELYVNWFDEFIKRNGSDCFDIIGLSYYPVWNGAVGLLKENLLALKKSYEKPTVIAEVAYPFTADDYSAYEGLAAEERKGMATKEEWWKNLEYPMTPKGQYEFMSAFILSLNEAESDGYFWWEPAWIPVKGCGWATEASLEYIRDKGPCGNEWANQALFDFDGNALPALSLFRG